MSAMSNTKFEAFLSHFTFENRKGDTIQAHCPAHEDKHGSLSITLASDKIHLCHAGCSVNSILLAADSGMADLFLNGERPPEAIYQYRNADGSLSHEKVKYRNADGTKDFKQRRLIADGIAYDLKDVKHIPYNFPPVLKAIVANELIVMPEGEKDADTAGLLGYVGPHNGRCIRLER